MKPLKSLVVGLSLTLFWSSPSPAHFGMVIPSTNRVDQDTREITMTLSFSHPFEAIGMDLAKPEKFYAVHEGQREDLLPGLSETTVMAHAAWKTQLSIKRPGVYQYVMEPTPYWEPAEDLFIVHYTKTLIAAYGSDENWDQPVGLPTEIVPLLRPFGNYAGNSFSGLVLLNGKPAANSEVEVEYYDREKNYAAPSDHHITQVIKTDANGVFSLTCPLPGWWGFSALNEADFTMKGPDNTDKNVEIGAVLWVHFDSYKEK